MQKYNETEQILAKLLDCGESSGCSEYGYGYILRRLRNAFDGVRHENGKMSFAEAMFALWDGERVGRSGWNGKDQWVISVAATQMTVKGAPETTYAVRPHLALKTVQGDIALGWTPSTGDLFADDWFVIK